MMKKSREMKYKQFIDFCKPTGKDLVLDVGVQNREGKDIVNFFEKLYPYKSKITALGIEDLTEFKKRYPKVKAVKYPGKNFPFKDKQFDFVWSNAVIEHVGSTERQELFVNEMIRVAKKKVVFTTPNMWFPVELHTKLPLFHYLPKKICDFFYAILGKKWATKEYMYLLSKRNIKKLLTQLKTKHSFEFSIKKNKTFGLTSTFTVFINKKH